MASHPRRAYKACKDCGRAGEPGNGLSFRGLCVDCSLARHEVVVRQMAEKRGPAFEQWQRSMLDVAREILTEQAVST